VPVKIRMALQTADARWRVEVAQLGSRIGYRILRDGDEWHAWTGIGAVELLLEREGVSMADLLPAAPTRP
jgi:hypothetical protein